MDRIYLRTSALYHKNNGTLQGHLQVYVSLQRGEIRNGSRQMRPHPYFPRMFVPFRRQGERYVLELPLEAKEVTQYYSRKRLWEISRIKPPSHETLRFKAVIEHLGRSLEELLNETTTPLSRVSEAARKSIIIKFPPYFRNCQEGKLYATTNRGKLLRVDLE